MRMHLRVFATCFIGTVQASLNGIDAVTEDNLPGFWHFLAFYIIVPLFTAKLASKWPPSGAYLEEAGSSPVFIDDLSSSTSYHGDVEVNLYSN
ncbi:hypothetical protein TELCIR_04592, partial [Teladorsagia circumcincta]